MGGGGGRNLLLLRKLGRVEDVIDRNDVGGWLEGPPSDQTYPGEQMSRPQKGPGSIARFGRRILAFILDWYLCWGLLLLVGIHQDSVFGSVVLLITVLLYQILCVGFMGHTLGHMLLGMQVQRTNGQPAGWLTALIRSFMVMLVLPVFIMDADQRGIHDRIRNTVLVRIR